jgi:phosphopantothenoylcysteine decarboxylase/phosphopantothenate--cysteine ligase
MDLQGKTILVCVTGGIAAYKVCDVVSKLVQAKTTVTVAMTKEAQYFVGPATFQALSGRAVATDMWASRPSEAPPHIDLAQSSDLILVAPCTANMMAKMAHGIADDLVSTLLLAADPRRVVIAPAMNQAMWSHPATRRNAKQLQEDGIQFIGPATGWQACRTVGEGRMSESAEILAWIEKKLSTA